MTRHRVLIGLVTGAFGAALLLGLGGCASKSPPRATTGASKPSTPSGTRPGAYYKDDGPAANLPADIDRIPDAEPRAEPLHRFANRPYNVFGVDYTPLTALTALRQRGIASWYGRKFHGQKTAIGEVYDMFAMTAAHPTAPLPSYARVSNPRSGRSVIVRINDRGPFHPGRVVDLSYAAAHRLGIAQGGSGEVDFELLLPPFSASATSAVAIKPATPVEQSPPSEPAPIATGPAAAAAGEAFYVQLGAFGNFANAQVFQQRMSAELATTPRVQQIDALFRVRLGPFDSREAAVIARDRAQGILATSLPIISGSVR